MISIDVIVSSHIISAINKILANVLSSIYTSIISVFDSLAFVDTSITEDLKMLIGTNFSSGILLICNSLIYGFVIYYAISLLLSHLTFAQVENPLQFIFKLLLCSLAINGSMFLCNFIIFLVSSISELIKLLASTSLGVEISFVSLINNLNPQNFFLDGLFNLFSFDGLLKSLISISFITLIISYAIRFVMIKVFVLLSPFAILSLSNAKTSWFFKSWLKNFLSMLFLQILIALILVIYFSISLNENLIIRELIQFGIIFTLVKANSFMRDFMGGLSSDVNFTNVSMFSMFKGGVSK